MQLPDACCFKTLFVVVSILPLFPLYMTTYKMQRLGKGMIVNLIIQNIRCDFVMGI